MTTEEKNILIAHFMEPYKEEGSDLFSLDLGSDIWYIDFSYPEDISFDSSWDWLIPACRKFDKLYLHDKKLKIGDNLLNMDYVALCDDLDNVVTKYEIAPAFNQLVKNIQWYNNQTI